MTILSKIMHLAIAVVALTVVWWVIKILFWPALIVVAAGLGYKLYKEYAK